MKKFYFLILLFCKVTGAPIPFEPNPFCGTDTFPFPESTSLPPGTLPVGLSAIGAQNTSFVLVNFQNNPNHQPWSKDSITTLFKTVGNFFYEASYQQTYLVGDVKGWFTIPVNDSDCNTAVNSMSDFRRGKYKIDGVDLTQINRVVFFFPQITTCSWTGLGEVGGTGNTAWINGNTEAWVVQHEMGHNLGLGHARFYACGGTNPIAPNCVSQEYGDPSDSMGNIFGGHYSSYHKEQIGWLDHGNAPGIEIVSAPGIFFIEPYETTTQNVKVLKILKETLQDGSKDFYYIEFRQPVGFDDGLQTLSSSNLVSGVLIHAGNNINFDSSLLYDMKPGTPTADDSALTSGASFSDAAAPGGGIQAKVLSISPSGATIQVDYGTNFTGTKNSGAPSKRPLLPVMVLGLLYALQASLN